jgi:peptidyl-prolyl cis-trans isomerase C
MNKALIIALSLTVGLVACSDEQASEGTVIATVGKRAITSAELDAYLTLKRISKDDSTRREKAIEEFLEREALADAIEQQKQTDAALITAELREHKKELLISRYFDKVLEDKVSPQAIQGFYGANASKYEEKKAHVAHILFRINPRMSEEERTAKRTAAQDAHARLQKGEDFAAVAQAVSEDTVSGKRGGDLGFLREGSIDPRFTQTVFAMQKDAISAPFETTFGFHIAKVIEPAQTIKRPLEAVEGDIRYELRAETKDAELKRLRELVRVERKDGVKPKATADKVGEATAKRD